MIVRGRPAFGKPHEIGVLIETIASVESLRRRMCFSRYPCNLLTSCKFLGLTRFASYHMIHCRVGQTGSAPEAMVRLSLKHEGSPSRLSCAVRQACRRNFLSDSCTSSNAHIALLLHRLIRIFSRRLDEAEPCPTRRHHAYRPPRARRRNQRLFQL